MISISDDDKTFNLDKTIEMLPQDIKKEFTKDQLSLIIDPKTSVRTINLQAIYYNK